jgi:hypothetical protein
MLIEVQFFLKTPTVKIMIWSFKFLDVYVLIKSNDLLLCYLFIKFVIFVIKLMSSRNLEL